MLEARKQERGRRPEGRLGQHRSPTPSAPSFLPSASPPSELAGGSPLGHDEGGGGHFVPPFSVEVLPLPQPSPSPFSLLAGGGVPVGGRRRPPQIRRRWPQIRCLPGHWSLPLADRLGGRPRLGGRRGAAPAAPHGCARLGRCGSGVRGLVAGGVRLRRLPRLRAARAQQGDGHNLANVATSVSGRPPLRAVLYGRIRPPGGLFYHQRGGPPAATALVGRMVRQLRMATALARGARSDALEGGSGAPEVFCVVVRPPACWPCPGPVRGPRGGLASGALAMVLVLCGCRRGALAALICLVTPVRWVPGDRIPPSCRQASFSLCLHNHLSTRLAQWSRKSTCSSSRQAEV